MKSKAKNKRGHRGGQWFTTQKPDSTEFHGGGGSDIGGFFLIILLFVVYAFIVRVYRFFLRLKSSPGKWENYHGLVYCQVHNDNLNFFQTVRGTSRVLLKPPVIVRPMADLGKFNINNTSMSLIFCDGLEINLYRITQGGGWEEFRELVKSAPNSM